MSCDATNTESEPCHHGHSYLSPVPPSLMCLCTCTFSWEVRTKHSTQDLVILTGNKLQVFFFQTLN